MFFHVFSRRKAHCFLIIYRKRLPIDHPLARRQISLVWRAGSPLEQNIQKLGLVFRDVAADLLDQKAKRKKGKT